MPTYNENLLPSSTGFDLGSSTQRWDSFIQNEDVSGNSTIAGAVTIGGALTAASATVASLSVTQGLATPLSVSLADPGTTLTFLGDSRTANITLDTYFPGKSYINKGVGGNTSANVLARVDADIDETASRAVVLDIGVNDVVNGVAIATTEANIVEIVGHLLTKGVRPVLAAIAPTGDAGWNATIVTLNTWIKAYAALTGIAVVDYYAALQSGGTANAALYNVDLIHPNAAGYAITMPLALAGAKMVLPPQAPPSLWSGTARNWYFNSPEAIGTFIRFKSTATNGREWGIGHNFVNGGGEFEVYDYTAGKRRYAVSTDGHHLFGSNPSTNLSIDDTGVMISNVATGAAPMAITSTTPVANLTTVPTAYNSVGVQQVNTKIVSDITALTAGSATVTLTGAAVFTGSTTYQVIAVDVTSASAVKIVKTSGSQFTITGTGGDIIGWIAIGN